MSVTAQNYCEEIYHLRKSNREQQHRINELLNVSKNGRSGDTRYITDALFLSGQMIQLCNTLDLFTSYFATLNKFFFFGHQRSVVDGKTLYIVVSDPILSSYEILYRKGKIAALYSEKNDICLCAYLHVGRLSLVTVSDICDLINIPPLFDKWHCLLQLIDNVNSIPFLTMLNSKIDSLNLEQQDSEHYNSKIQSLQVELMKWNESRLSHLFVPFNLTDITNRMFSQIFSVTNASPIFNYLIRPIGTVAQIHDTMPQDSFKMTSSQRNESVTSSEPLTSSTLSTKSIYLDHNSTDQPDSTYSVNECYKPPIEHVNRKMHKSEQQKFDELTDKISKVILSTDSPSFEDYFSNNPLEALDESSAFQAKDDFNRTPDPLISMTTIDNLWMRNMDYFEATQPQNAKESPSSKVAFLSPLKDDDY